MFKNTKPRFSVKLIKLYCGLLISLIPFTSNASTISVFTDNGVMVTETRTDTTTGDVSVWEWLDLTITNGLTHHSVVADLANNGKLDNSGNVLVGNDGAIADVLNLTNANNGGWATVSLQDVANMFNQYFSITVNLTGDRYNTHDMPAPEILVDQFITEFGDTHSEGIDDVQNNDPGSPFAQDNEFNSTLAVGTTNTSIDSGLGDLLYTQVLLSDLETSGSDYTDVYSFKHYRPGYNSFSDEGTWLIREASPVPLPPSLALFCFGLLGLSLSRRRKTK